MSLRDKLFSEAKKLPQKAVDVSEFLPFEVSVKVLTGTELDRYNATIREATETKMWAKSRATLVALSICDKDGNPLATLDDVPQICDWNGKLLDKLFEASFYFNKIGVEESAEVEKN